MSPRMPASASGLITARHAGPVGDRGQGIRASRVAAIRRLHSFHIGSRSATISVHGDFEADNTRNGNARAGEPTERVEHLADTGGAAFRLR